MRAGWKQVYPYADLSRLDVICREVFLSLAGGIMHDMLSGDRGRFEPLVHECGLDLRVHTFGRSSCPCCEFGVRFQVHVRGDCARG